jgi:hypothetical protein
MKKVAKVVEPFGREAILKGRQCAKGPNIEVCFEPVHQVQAGIDIRAAYQQNFG